MTQARQSSKQQHKRQPVQLLVAILCGCLVVQAILFAVEICYPEIKDLFRATAAQAADNQQQVGTTSKTTPVDEMQVAELLQKKEQQLRQKEAELQALKQEVSAKLAELMTLQKKVAKELENLQQSRNNIREKRLKQLADMYKSMEPGKAAKLMEKLDEKTAVQIITRMRGRAAGQILAQMQADKAARISKRLSSDERELRGSSSRAPTTRPKATGLQQNSALLSRPKKLAASEGQAVSRDSLLSVVEKWRQAWQQGDLSAYLSCYHPEFTPAGMDHQAWQEKKERFFQKKEQRRIVLSDISTKVKDSSAEVVFKQHFSSTAYQDFGVKTLDFSRYHNNWRIVREEWRPLADRA
ncbi:MAG: hypothetical protein JRJ12_03190 [Deltaproteobacteria bacterium]|nr:hypothetical protein [Deltaproteobacteria bacterium]MBW2069729.1 hypothetical protein [Deltaproteobacteria bacterium]